MSRPGRGWFRGCRKRFLPKPLKTVGQVPQIFPESSWIPRCGVITRFSGRLDGLGSGLEDATDSEKDVTGSHRSKSQNDVSARAPVRARVGTPNWENTNVQILVHVPKPEPGYLTPCTVSQSAGISAKASRERKDRDRTWYQVRDLQSDGFRRIGLGLYLYGRDGFLRTSWPASQNRGCEQA